MEEWRDLAKTVPGTLFTVAFDIEELLGLVATARTRVTPLVAAVHMRQAEAPHGDIGDNLAALLRSPGEDLDGAVRELARLAALHAGSAHAVLLYAERVGLDDDDARWLGWQQHHADALRHATAALQTLRAAAARARAYEDAIRTVWSFPLLSPDWAGWMAASVDLVRFVRISAAMALRALRRMRRAIVQEFHDAWRVANP